MQFYCPHVCAHGSQCIQIRENMLEFSSTVLSALSLYPMCITIFAIIMCRYIAGLSIVCDTGYACNIYCRCQVQSECLLWLIELGITCPLSALEMLARHPGCIKVLFQLNVFLSVTDTTWSTLVNEVRSTETENKFQPLSTNTMFRFAACGLWSTEWHSHCLNIATAFQQCIVCVVSRLRSPMKMSAPSAASGTEVSVVANAVADRSSSSTPVSLCSLTDSLQVADTD